MAIRERSFRIGCGRYLQEAGILASCGDEVRRLGRSPLILGGATALSLTRDTIEQSVSASCERYLIVEHGGSCNDEDAKALAELSASLHYDVIVGVGGGVLMDFAKLVGYYASRPVINIPTSTATCAAYTPLSVCYTPEGRTVGTRHFSYEVAAVIADTALLARQPKRLLLAGMFDALAKFVEIKHRFKADAECPLGLDWAYMLSSHSYTELFDKIPTCLSDLEAGRVSSAVEQVIFTSLAVTGVISGIARGSNQTALAHKFYEITRVLFPEESKPYLHGEIVGVGLLLQNIFNGEEQENRVLRELMQSHGMPSRLSDVGVPATAEVMEKYIELMSGSSAVSEAGDGAVLRLRAAMKKLFLEV